MIFEFPFQVPNFERKFFIKMGTVGTYLFHVGRKTDRYDETNIRFSEFCERP